MFKEAVRVVDVKGSEVKVRFEKKTMCSCCSMKYMCGSSDDTMRVQNVYGYDIKRGDEVEIGIEEGKNALVSILTFAVPAVIFVCILFLFRTKNHIVAFCAGAAGIILYYVVIGIFFKKYGKKVCFKIMKKV